MFKVLSRFYLISLVFNDNSRLIEPLKKYFLEKKIIIDAIYTFKSKPFFITDYDQILTDFKINSPIRLVIARPIDFNEGDQIQIDIN